MFNLHKTFQTFKYIIVYLHQHAYPVCLKLVNIMVFNIHNYLKIIDFILPRLLKSTYLQDPYQSRRRLRNRFGFTAEL